MFVDLSLLFRFSSHGWCADEKETVFGKADEEA